MKYKFDKPKVTTEQSHPARGAWIEIYIFLMLLPECRSHPARGAWIEM